MALHLISGAPGTIDSATDSTTTLTLQRTSSANTNALLMKNNITGGRVGATWRVTRAGVDYDLLRIQAHDAVDPGSSTSQGVVYTQRATPRIGDGLLVEARQLWFSEVDFGTHGFYAGQMLINTHDTDNLLHTDQSGFVAQRSPTDNANESTELLRARTSGVGSNYFHRDLAAVDTNGPLVRILNDNVGDDQAALRLTNDCSQAGLDVENTSSSGAGVAIFVRSGYIDMLEQTVPPNAATDRGRLFLQDNGAGKTQLCVRFATGTPIVIATQA